ncbi:hypothetical protein KSS87_016314 [Heliosperma pusillum]|nr:hypothetical protein KSS87_016314 [Heliosperma pusillum]
MGVACGGCKVVFIHLGVWWGWELDVVVGGSSSSWVQVSWLGGTGWRMVLRLGCRRCWLLGYWVWTERMGEGSLITSCAAVLSFKGSPYWMAPEVVMNKNGYSLEVDIWSLGCTILEMAMAKPPWSQYEGVAAIFKIGNSKDIPVIPDFLSDNAKKFLNLCLQRDPSKRPSASYLLEHPFVKDQCAGKIVYVSTTNETTPFSFDGFSNKPQPLEIQPRRKSISSYDIENMRRPGPAIWEARDNLRSITSLPVSPCSSPLRQLGATSNSCFLSPPHPSYAWPVQSSSYNTNNQSLSPTRRRPVGYTLDPLIESTLFRGQTPGGSPRMRLI